MARVVTPLRFGHPCVTKTRAGEPLIRSWNGGRSDYSLVACHPASTHGRTSAPGTTLTPPIASVGARIVPETATPSSPLNKNSPWMIGAGGDSLTNPEVAHVMLTTAPFTTVNVNGSS